MKCSIIDGERRYHAHKKAGRQTVKAIVIKLPLAYARIIACAANLRNGEKLNSKDNKTNFEEYVTKHPDTIKQLQGGALKQSDLARKLTMFQSGLTTILQRDVLEVPRIDGLVELRAAFGLARARMGAPSRINDITVWKTPGLTHSNF